jgi:hypothetical protein
MAGNRRVGSSLSGGILSGGQGLSFLDGGSLGSGGRCGVGLG